ncbi:protein of unknown function [Candidatus Nitrospira inopinata]|uniref:Uncharacterized protein n=1 Tax=Candidatus Nitrospira inopinata TaxID=1715989 RepID=A0A0S4KT06_9BACT|nr:protein of unknown function [Candidatus Nitrospira inopinata]
MLLMSPRKLFTGCYLPLDLA